MVKIEVYTKLINVYFFSEELWFPNIQAGSI